MMKCRPIYDEVLQWPTGWAKKPGQCLFRASLGVLQSLKAKAADFRQVAPFCVIILTIAEFRIQQR